VRDAGQPTWVEPIKRIDDVRIELQAAQPLAAAHTSSLAAACICAVRVQGLRL
jgi:hypothetical protein